MKRKLEMEIWDELHPDDIEGDDVLVPREYYINDISEEERSKVPFWVDNCYSSLEDALEALKRAIDFGDILDFQDFIRELFEWRTDLDTEKFAAVAYFHMDEDCLEFLIFSKDKDKSGTFGSFDISSQTPEDINRMVNQGLIIRRLVYFPEDENKWSIDPIIRELTLANYYMNKGHSVLSYSCLA